MSTAEPHVSYIIRKGLWIGLLVAAGWASAGSGFRVGPVATWLLPRHVCGPSELQGPPHGAYEHVHTHACTHMHAALLFWPAMASCGCCAPCAALACRRFFSGCVRRVPGVAATSGTHCCTRLLLVPRRAPPVSATTEPADSLHPPIPPLPLSAPCFLSCTLRAHSEWAHRRGECRRGVPAAEVLAATRADLPARAAEHTLFDVGCAHAHGGRCRVPPTEVAPPVENNPAGACFQVSACFQVRRRPVLLLAPPPAVCSLAVIAL
jgi:hypothetical protein